jgi:hypothetical protein
VPHELATTRRRAAPPLIGFVCLTESFERPRCHAYWVSVSPLCRYLSLLNRSTRRTDSPLRFPHRRPCRDLSTAEYPLPGFGSLSEYHPCITAKQAVIPEDRAVSPLPRFLPLQRLSATRSHLPPPVPIPPVKLRPQGFSPSRRFAPLGWPSGLVSSQYRSWGFTLRGFSPRPVPYVLSNAVPLYGFLLDQKRRGHPFRDSHTGQSRCPAW